jgi:Fe-S oxidoreductase
LKKNNPRLINLTDKCTNCGNCRIVCPVFLELKEEIYSPRGRINLIKGLAENELSVSGEVRERISICLGCGQCVNSCPAEVNYPEIVRNARFSIRSGSSKYLSSLNAVKKLFSSNGKESEMFFKIAGAIIRNILLKNKFKTVKNAVFSVLKIPNTAIMPYMPVKDLFKMKTDHALKNDKGIRIALFTGCGGRYVYPGTADRFVSILRSNGIEVLIPQSQVCCGNPLIYRGLLKESISNIKANAEAFNELVDIRYIVGLCSNASMTFLDTRSKGIKPGFRMEFIDWIDLIGITAPEIEPAYENSVIFHSCPKCGRSSLYKNLVDRLYHDYTEIPPFSGDYCGSTELLDKSNFGLRFSVTDSFYTKNRLDEFDFIACASFECMEYLNNYFIAKNKKIRAIHFIDALKSVKT